VILLITMNMPSAQGYLVHQVTVEHPAQSIDEFYKELHETDFVFATQLYRKKDPRGDVHWEDRGKIILNSAHIGKVQEFIEFPNAPEQPFGFSKGEYGAAAYEAPRPVRRKV
jgi:hypothetical protein